LIDQSDDIPYQLGIAAAALVHEESEFLLAAARHGAVLDVDNVVGAGILVHQANQVRTPSGEAARRQARKVMQRLDGGEDARARLFPDIRFVVQNARYGLDGNACGLRHVVDGFARHRRAPSLRMRLGPANTRERQEVAARIRQKPRFLPVATESMSAKALAHFGPQATFANKLVAVE